MSDHKPTFEMANSDDPEGIIAAAQHSVIFAMQGVIAGLQKESGAPGLTWDQLNYLLNGFMNKKPIVIHQDGEM